MSSPESVAPPTFDFEVNGETVTVADSGWTLLDVLRHQFGLRSVKDGCAPQGQCGCCTVLVDGKPRVACVTPARRVRGRAVTTLEGLDEARRAQWGSAFCDAGASQCGFCTPGIIMRLDPLVDAGSNDTATDSNHQSALQQSGLQHNVDQALLAHLCRCTGWQTIKEAAEVMVSLQSGSDKPATAARDLDAAGRRATIEGRAPQTVSPEVALGAGGFAVDTVPEDHLVAMLDRDNQWIVGESVPELRAKTGKIQGRRTTAAHRHPLAVPDAEGDEWVASLCTTWVDGAYLETDAAWCRPGEEPTVALAANGGAFGAKAGVSRSGSTEELGGEAGVIAAAKQLSAEYGRTVLALASREDVARHSPKRPPVAGAIRPDGTGVIRVADTPGVVEAIASVAPGLVVEAVPVPGPPTSIEPRGAGWVEALVLASAVPGSSAAVSLDDAGVVTVVSPDGAEAKASIDDEGRLSVSVACGPALDETILRSYCIGAAHMAWSWLTSEAMLVDDQGLIHDLTIRSFGVLRALDTPPISVRILEPNAPDTGADTGSEREPVNGSDAVFAAVAVAGWHHLDRPTYWPADPSALA